MRCWGYTGWRWRSSREVRHCAVHTSSPANHAKGSTSVVNKRVNNAATKYNFGALHRTSEALLPPLPFLHTTQPNSKTSSTTHHLPSALHLHRKHTYTTPLSSPLFLFLTSLLISHQPPRKDESRSVRALFPHLLPPQRSKRPLLVFLSARRKAFEKSASCTEQSSTWTLTLEFRSRSASSRRRTGATPPKQPPRLTSKERSPYPQDSSASDGRNNTPLSQPVFPLAATNSARKKCTSAKRTATTVRAAEKISTSVKSAG